MTFDLRDVDISAVMRLIMGQALPTDNISMVAQRIIQTTGTRDSVLQHSTTITQGSGAMPSTAACYHCHRSKPVFSGIPIAVESVDNKPRYIMTSPWVCSYGCMLAASETLAKCQHSYQNSHHLCMSLYDEINPGGYVAKAPPYTMLQVHGGTMSDQEYDSCTGPCVELPRCSIKSLTYKVQVHYQ